MTSRKNGYMLEHYEVVKNTLPFQAGRFGKIVLARQKIDGKLVMLKSVLLKEFLTEEQRNRELASREPELLLKLNGFTHANIIQLYNYFFKNDVLYLVLEYCDGGNLAKFLDARAGKLLEEQQIQSWFCQLALVVSFIHEQQIIHRGITSDNIFLDHDAKVLKLGSFDIAKTIEESLRITPRASQNSIDSVASDDGAFDGRKMPDIRAVVGKTIVGKPTFMAPEMLGPKFYDQQADIWQMGLVLFHMTTLKEPVIEHGVDPIETNHAAISSFSKELVDLLVRILSARENPYDRPTIKNIISDPFILIPISNYVARGALTAPGPRESVHTWDEIEARHRPYYQKRYWESIKMVPGKTAGSIWWTAPSHVTEIIPHPMQNIVIVVCYNGDVVALRKNEESATEAWSGHVAMTTNYKSKIMHAALDHYTGRLYFTTWRNDGIHYASLGEIEQKSPGTVISQCFIETTKQYPHFDGLAVDAEHSLVYACDELDEAIRIFSLVNRRCLLRITAGTDKKMSPYKCALHRLPAVDSGEETSNDSPKMAAYLLAVSDRKRSQIVLFKVKIYSTSHRAYELDLRSELVGQLASAGSEAGQTLRPKGLFFDKIGNLLVADDGNGRIQGFAMKSDGERLKATREKARSIKALKVGTTISSLLATVDTALPDHERRLFLLAGLYGSTPHIGIQGVLCFKVISGIEPVDTTDFDYCADNPENK